MKNLKLNFKHFLMRNMLAIVLLSTPATLTGCGNETEVKEETDTTYVWADNKGVIEYTPNETNDDEVQTIHYIDSNGLLRTTYIDTQAIDKYICTNTNGVIIYNIVDEKKLTKFINRNDLISIPDNLDELIEATKDNNLALGYEYIGNYEEKNFTGNVYLTIHYYQTYKIEINEAGKYILVEGPVILHMEDWYEEYPYIKENYDQTFSYDITEIANEKNKESLKEKLDKALNKSKRNKTKRKIKKLMD